MFYVILICALLLTKCLIVQTDYVSMHLNELVQFNGQRREEMSVLFKTFLLREVLTHSHTTFLCIT